MINGKPIIDMNSFFVLNDFFQQKDTAGNENNADDFFIGYIEAETYLLPDIKLIEPVIIK